MNTRNERPLSFISFDVEALPNRASQDHVDRLIWGKLDGGEFGIRRISGILKQHGIKGNFLIDFSACLLYGDKAVKEIAQYLLGQGHEVHVHLHSEWVVRHWGLESAGWSDDPVGMDQIDGALSQAILDFAAFKFRALVGKEPALFRAGAFRFNAATIEASARAGFKVCSNFNSERHAANWNIADPRASNNEVFRWNERLLELPVDFSPEPLTHDWGNYEGYFARIQNRKKFKTFNLTLHSWSLLKLGNDGHFNHYEPAHEERLHKICEHLKAFTTPLGYDEFIASHPAIPAISHAQCSSILSTVDIPTQQCGICGAVYGLKLPGDVCPSCGARARHRQIQDVLSRTGNLFAGRTVLACHANQVEILAFLAHATKVVNFDVRPLGGSTLQMDIQSMDKAEDASFDAFVAIHVLNHVADDRKALQEIHRVLKPGGTALITVPCREDASTVPCENVAEHYGVEALNNYGVGTYRRYGLRDALDLFEEFFDVVEDKGLDGLTGQSEFVFILHKPFVDELELLDRWPSHAAMFTTTPSKPSHGHSATISQLPLDTNKIHIKTGNLVLGDSFVSGAYKPAGKTAGYDFRFILPHSLRASGVGAKIRLRGWKSVASISIGYTIDNEIINIKTRKIALDKWFIIEFDHSDIAFRLTNQWMTKNPSSINDIRIYIQGEAGPEGALLDVDKMCCWHDAEELLPWLQDFQHDKTGNLEAIKEILGYYQRNFEVAKAYQAFSLNGLCPLSNGKQLLQWSPYDDVPAQLSSSTAFRFSWHAWHPATVMLVNYHLTKTDAPVYAARDFANHWLEKSYFCDDPDIKYAWYDLGTADRLMSMLLLWAVGVEKNFDFRFMARLRHAIFKHGQLLAAEAFYAYTQNSRYHTHAWFQDTALIAASLVMPDFPCSRRWFEIAQGRLEDQINHLLAQENGYSVFVQNSIAYHCGIQALLGFAGRLAKLAQGNMSIARASAGFDKFSNLFRYPDKRYPSQGDTCRSPNQLNLLPDAGQSADLAASQCIILPKSGYGIIKGHHDHRFFMLSALATSLSDIHKHEDNLSFSLFFDGIEWLIDPGFYSHDYAQPIPAYLRSASAHNAIALPQLPYSIKPGTAQLQGHIDGTDYIIEMEHRCYPEVMIERQIRGSLNKLDLQFTDRVVLLDDGLADKLKIGHLMFQCGEHVAVACVGNRLILSHPASRYRVELQLPCDRIEVAFGEASKDNIRGVVAHNTMELANIYTIDCSVDIGVDLKWSLQASLAD